MTITLSVRCLTKLMARSGCDDFRHCRAETGTERPVRQLQRAVTELTALNHTAVRPGNSISVTMPSL